MSVTERYTPPVDALLLQHLDERVAVALRDENAYWQSAQNREQNIKARCAEAALRAHVATLSG